MPNILVAEDDVLILEAIQDVLELDGHMVRAAKNGAKAIKALGGFLPDLVIADVFMPDMDGFELYDRINKDFSNASIPFVFISCMDVSGKISKFERKNVVFLKKPFGVEDLLRTVQVALG